MLSVPMARIGGLSPHRAWLPFASLAAILAATAMIGRATHAAGPPASAPPAPVLGERVNLYPLSGAVFLRLPGTRQFVALDRPRQVPIRTVVDAREGRVRLVSVGERAGSLQRARISRGLFLIRQFALGRRKGLIELRLKGGPSKAECEQALASGSLRRRLRVRARGRHRTRTSGVAGTVRGTSWEVTDSCGLVDTRVLRGEVLVENFTRRRVVRRLVGPGGRFRTRGRYSAATVRGG
jgi:hypothetical protein